MKILTWDRIENLNSVLCAKNSSMVYFLRRVNLSKVVSSRMMYSRLTDHRRQPAFGNFLHAPAPFREIQYAAVHWSPFSRVARGSKKIKVNVHKNR